MHNNRMICLKAIVQYLDDSKHFERMRRTCLQGNDLESIVYRFPVEVNLFEISDKYVHLGNEIASSPVKSSSLFNEVIYEFLRSQNLIPANVSPSQVLAKLSFTGPPCFYLSDLIRYSSYRGLIKLHGFVSGLSGTTKYTQSTRYICSDSLCEGHYGNHFIRVHIPGASETQTIRSDFICTFCGGVLQEVMSFRTLSDKMILEMMPIRVESHQRKEKLMNRVSQAVPVIFHDHLTDQVELGKSYVVTGICRNDSSDDNVTVTLEAYNIEEVILSKLSKQGVVQTLPETVAMLYHDCESHPWRFVLSMALHFANTIVPLGKMYKLRLMLLISIVLSPEENKLHILTVGEETELAFLLMKYAEQFSRRSVPNSMATSLRGRVCNNRYLQFPYFIEGGVFHLSAYGICCLGEICMWKKPRTEHLKSALNRNKVMVDLASKYTGGLSQTVSFPLLCQIWAVKGTVETRPKTDPASSDVFKGYSCGNLSKDLLDAFNIIMYLDTKHPVYDIEEDVHTLNFKWKAHCPESNFSESSTAFQTSDYDQYISLARQMDTKISEDAESLLHAYCNASKLTRCSEYGASNFPPSAYSSLVSLSRGIAKLQLHETVIETDAILGTYLYEEYISNRYGLSALSIQPQPDIPVTSINNFINAQCGILRQQFIPRLQQFCSRVSDGRPFNILSESPTCEGFLEE